VSVTGSQTFTVRGAEYIIDSSVFSTIRSYLYEDEHIKWVRVDEPFVKYGVKTGNREIKTVVRLATDLLTETELGRKVAETQTKIIDGMAENQGL